MKEIDTERIKNMTSQMIGYENFKKEKVMKRMKMRKVAYVFLGAVTLCMGTLTVDAMTNNAISNTVKDIFSINFDVDGDEKNASCIKQDDGTFTCTVDGENGSFDIMTSENND